MSQQTVDPKPAKKSHRIHPLIWGVLIVVVIISLFILIESSTSISPQLTLTLSGFEILQTIESEHTQAAQTQVAMNSTATAQIIQELNITEVAQQIMATENSAFATLTALAAPSTPTPQAQYFTPLEVFDAYASGNFRMIRGIPIISPDGLYFALSNNAVYTINGQFHFTIRGHNAVFSSDSKYIAASDDGVYNVSNGQYLFEIMGQNPTFSPDGTLIAVGEDGVYRISDGQRLFPISGNYPIFSKDSNYLIAQGDALYNLSDGRRIIDVSTTGVFSPDNTFVAVTLDGLYRISDGQRLFEINNSGSFSPDSQYLLVSRDAVYRIRDGQALFRINHNAIFSPDGIYIAIDADGVYQLSNRERLFPILYSAEAFSPNSAYLTVRGETAVYRISDGQQLITGNFSPRYFSPDNTMITIGRDGLYDLSTGQRLFSINGYTAAFSSDNAYLTIEADGTYRISDGEYYGGLGIISYEQGILSLGRTTLFIDPTVASRRFNVIRVNGNVSLHLSLSPEQHVVTMTATEEIFPSFNYLNGFYEIYYLNSVYWVSEDDVTRLPVISTPST